MAIKREPTTSMSPAGLLASPAMALVTWGGAFALATLAATPSPDLDAFAKGALFAGVPSVLFPIGLLLVGRAPVSMFATAVLGLSMLRMVLAVAFGLWAGPATLAILTGAEAIEPARAQVGGVAASAILCLTAETIAAVLALRPTWDATTASSTEDNRDDADTETDTEPGAD